MSTSRTTSIETDESAVPDRGIDAAVVDQILHHEEDHLRALQRMSLLSSDYQWTLDLVRPIWGHVS